jgi:hypothetical protein
MPAGSPLGNNKQVFDLEKKQDAHSNALIPGVRRRRDPCTGHAAFVGAPCAANKGLVEPLSEYCCHSMRIEDQPKFGLWKRAVLRVIETREARDSKKQGTQEWEAADAEYRQALEGYRRIRDLI